MSVISPGPGNICHATPVRFQCSFNATWPGFAHAVAGFSVPGHKGTRADGEVMYGLDVQPV
jgi:hypothetical protein